MKIYLLTITLLGIFWLSCSSSSNTPNTPNPPNPPVGPNWSIYLDSSELQFDPLSPTLWGTDITNQSFLSAWDKEKFVDNGNFFSGISAVDWSSGITTLKGPLKATLPTIKSYTCYDRKKTDSFGRAINSNCTNNNGLSCNVLYHTSAKQPQSLLCVITTPGSATTPAQFTACTAQDMTLGTVGCYPDGQGPSPSNKHLKGFYCTGWQQTTYDLTKVNLVLNNIRETPSKPYGCMSPATIMAGDTAWGALGIGSTCTVEDPSITNVGTAVPNPLYLDPVITYSNPYSDDQISGITPLTNLLSPTDPQYSIWNQWQNFCTTTNAGFCKSNNKSRSGIAHIFGRSGPVVVTSYVQLLNKIAPNDYSWQYDDASALIQCNSATSKAIAYFCGGQQMTVVDAKALFSKPLNGSGNGRFAVVNNCEQEIWVQQKPVTAVFPHITPKLVNDGACVPADSNDLKCDFLVHLKPGAAHVYNTPTTGLQSGNIWAKTGCSTDGYHCLTGETEDNSARPGYDSTCPDTAQYINDVCQPNLGPQPDIETKVEFTFGCTTPTKTACQQTGGSSPTTLSQASYLDITYVDGYTWPVSMQILPGSDEPSSSCVSHDAAPLDITQCPTAEDLSTRPNG